MLSIVHFVALDKGVNRSGLQLAATSKHKALKIEIEWDFLFLFLIAFCYESLADCHLYCVSLTCLVLLVLVVYYQALMVVYLYFIISFDILCFMHKVSGRN